VRQLSFFPVSGVIKNCGKCLKDYRDCTAWSRAHYCPACKVPRKRDYIETKPKFGQKLTTRELQIAAMRAEGKQNKEIAWDCKIGLGTIKVYTSNMYIKVGVRGRVSFVLWWLKKNNKLVA